ncbi:copper resistance CopC family protein [Nonomuraea glycinis]|uniref:copper resistance CopC family protein n=1 Tax=Nonomuraea glycinis TaxID=2047744 RepID=UPI002E0DC9DB|nr:copper resistance protein CopC [Nonomuraea glycinis]
MTRLLTFVRRAVTSVVGASLVLLLTTPAALAHDRLKSSSPADNAKLKQLETIELEYTARVRMPFIVLNDPDGKPVPLSKPRIQGNTVNATLTRPLTPGQHRIAWRVVSSDGHPIEGEITFTITAPPASPTPSPSPSETAASASSPAPQPASEQPTSEQTASSVAAAPAAEGGGGLPGWLWAALAVLVAAGAALLVAGRRKGGSSRS